MINEAIILAGGLGTRLRSAVPNLPKCMASVAGKPFLYFVIEYFKKQGIEKFIFSLGYKHEIIQEYLNEQYSTLDIKYSIEKEPLGTGGAIKLACEKAKNENILIVNGDTLFKVDTKELSYTHEKLKSECTLSLKPLKKFDRYGSVEIDVEKVIQSFKEKKYTNYGLINGGVYALNVNEFLSKKLADKFSFEKDYLEKYRNSNKFYGLVQDQYFIDIGIPEDYERAKHELHKFYE